MSYRKVADLSHKQGVQMQKHGADGGRAFDLEKLSNLKIKDKFGKRSTAGRKRGIHENNNVVVRKDFNLETKKNMTPPPSEAKQKLDSSDNSRLSLNIGDDQNLAVVDYGESMMDSVDIVEEKDSIRNHNQSGWLSSMFDLIPGKKSYLSRTDVQPAIKALKDKLLTKNVAEEIAQELCESVSARLVGKTGKSFLSFLTISSTVKAAMKEALVRILTPKHSSIDILRDVYAAKEQRRPYVVVFVGVNGVGKSTNLAKIAYWLKQHNINVMMAACDTFRSGAIEQLQIHARRLDIPLFEKGYDKKPAIVAKEAIKEAIRNGSDVLLVDTAGRMQDNEPLMQSLSRLVYGSNPDLILFVGDALAGNDAAHQLTKFNQKLADFSPSPLHKPRLIDGILLSKFDTIDDKVGAALSMAYNSGSPVMFVGCGQSYTDLQRFNVESIVTSLLK